MAGRGLPAAAGFMHLRLRLTNSRTGGDRPAGATSRVKFGGDTTPDFSRGSCEPSQAPRRSPDMASSRSRTCAFVRV